MTFNDLSSLGRIVGPILFNVLINNLKDVKTCTLSKVMNGAKSQSNG